MKIVKFPEAKLLSIKEVEQYIPDIKERWINWKNLPWAYLNSLDLYEFVTIPHDPKTQKKGNLVLNENIASYKILEKTEEEIATEQIEANTALVSRIIQASTDYISTQLAMDGMLLVDRMVRLDIQEAIGTESWLMEIRNEAYFRKALVEADAVPEDVDLLDFSSFGDKPYTIEELMTAAGIG